MSFILVVDDEPDICSLLKGIFEDDGCRVRVAENSNEALNAIEEKEPDLVILDIWLRNSEMDGIEILKMITKSAQNIPVVIISGHGNIEVAVEAIKLGAYDFIEKPFNTERIRLVKDRAIESKKLKTALYDLKKQNRKEYTFVGNSQIAKSLRKELLQLANRNSRILLTGPAGVGKETVAGYLHGISEQHKGEFHVILCSSLSDQNFDEFLCGKEDGDNFFPGALDNSEGGTLYLKEITELPTFSQKKLLDILASNSFKRCGGSSKVPLKTRIISGSRFSSKTILQRNMISLELFHRLNLIEIAIPSLSRRSDDITVLSEYFLRYFHENQNLPSREISSSAIHELKAISWMGNVRQLKNLIEKILILGEKGGLISKEEVSLNNKDFVNQNSNFDLQIEDLLSVKLKEARSSFEYYYLSQQIQKFNGNITKAANFIGMERSALHRKIKDLDPAKKK